MEAAAWVLLAVLLLVLAGGGWVVARLLSERSRLEARAVQGEAGVEEARRALAATEERARAVEAREREVQEKLASARAMNAQLEEAIKGERALGLTRLEEARAAKAELEVRVIEIKSQMEQTFGALAAKALTQSSGEFLKLAEQKLAAKGNETAADIEKRREAVDRLVQPIAETLKKTDEKLAALERTRTESEARLLEQVRQVTASGLELRSETAKLVKALREPHVRGRYGEIQLRRVAELAGMRSYCDFVEQDSSVDGDGNALRPDMVVRLPNGRELVIDSKANLKPYLDACEATDEDERERHLRQFADGIVKQAGLLSKKEYFRNYEGSPDFVVMFVPGDAFVDAALAKRPDLLDIAASQRVLLASPSTLIAMLRAVAVGFAEQKLTKEAAEIRKLAVELHERAATMLDHLAGVGNALNSTVDRFNKLTGSVQSRVMPTLRRIEASGAGSSKELTEPSDVVVRPREIEGVSETTAS